MGQSIKRRKWTPNAALSYVNLVLQGKAPVGLKYCSARDYLGGLKARAEAGKGGTEHGSGGGAAEVLRGAV